MLEDINSLLSQTGIWTFTVCLISFFFLEFVIYAIAWWNNNKTPVITLRFIPFILVVYTVLSALLSKFTSSQLLKPLEYFRKLIRDFYTQKISNIQESNFYVRELIDLKKFVINALSLQTEKIKRDQEINRFSRQVAHDIRTPLLALESMADDFEEDNSEKSKFLRKLAARINSIAESFLSIAKNDSNTNLKIQSVQREELVFPLIEEVIHEKKMQCKKHCPDFQFNMADNTRFICVKLNSSEFMRVISNLLDNSIQAIKQGRGKILISMKKVADFLHIEIKDNGCGIPQDKLDEVCEEGVSVGKIGGSGYGLSYAKKIVESIGGELNIKSEIDKGTIVNLNLLPSCLPDWLAEICKINHLIYVVDDDPNIFELFKEMFAESKQYSHEINLKFCINPEEFLKDFNTNEKSTIFMDYRFSNSKYDGLKFLEENRECMQNDVYVITNDYDSEELKNKLSHIGLKMIPKPCLRQLKMSEL